MGKKGEGSEGPSIVGLGEGRGRRRGGEEGGDEVRKKDEGRSNKEIKKVRLGSAFPYLTYAHLVCLSVCLMFVYYLTT